MKPKILMSLSRNVKNYYRDAVESCGAVAVQQYLPEISTQYDGLLLGGGADIDPKFYGEPVNGSVGIDLARDEREFALAQAFLDAGKPILGICRGHQVLNVFFGGSLYQHLDQTELHRRTDDADAAHPVTAVRDSILAGVYGEQFRVNSAHHQGIKRLGTGLQITATADGVVEAVEHEKFPVIGLQFHPERMCLSERRADTVDGIEIIRYFVNLCK